ncbi:MAG TPA: nucleotidyltransferase family protein [Thermoanaerobaculia bacterium]|nr:nucleotidyltransferase family protein [Thermoanaerobaculia bacterium]
MRPPGLRFHPPERRLPAGVRWALARAFGPIEAATWVGAEEGVEAAGRLRLAARIASRVASGSLIAELGAQGAGALRRERMAAAARAAWLAEAATDAIAVLQRAGLAPVLLKFVALSARGCLAEGARAASDVDLLLDEHSGRVARGALLAEGFVELGGPGEQHHLPAVAHPRGAVVEIHTATLGVRLGARSASASELERAGLLEAAGGAWRGARLPTREVLVAHALAHGLAQHGLSPRAYPLLQPWADLADLDWPADRADRAAEVEPIRALLRGTLADDEVAAAAELALRLRVADSELLAGVAADGAAATLLHHLVWGLLDHRYGDALRVRAVTEPLSDDSSSRALLRAVRRALWPSQDELAAIYGRPRERVGLWLRLYRPLDLVGRSVRSAWSATRLGGGDGGGGGGG